MGDLIMMRTFGQDRLDDMASNSRVPVINGLTNEYHPCQILTDILTYEEHRGSIAGKTVAWVGDANNMAYTWIEAAKLLGFKLHFSSPKGYELDPALTIEGEHLKVFDDPLECCKGADLVTTDVWTSMGYEEENAVRRAAFAKWQVNADSMAVANEGALFMHCLPAHRGEEVTADVIDGSQSVVWDEAENRLHAQKASWSTACWVVSDKTLPNALRSLKAPVALRTGLSVFEDAGEIKRPRSASGGVGTVQSRQERFWFRQISSGARVRRLCPM